MENAGQACNAAKRIIVADSVYDDFMQEFTAMAARSPGTRPTRRPPTGRCPPSRPPNLMGQIDDAVSKGATCTPAVTASTGRALRRGDGARMSPRRCGRSARSCSARWPSCTGSRRRGRRAGERQSLTGSAEWSTARRPRALDARRPARHRHGLDQPARGRRSGPPVRRHEAFRRRPGTRALGIDEFVNKKLIHASPRTPSPGSARAAPGPRIPPRRPTGCGRPPRGLAAARRPSGRADSRRTRSTP